MTISTGWFFLYKGNGYGPYPDWDTALGRFREKHQCDPDSVIHPVYGTAHVENKQLIKFERKKKTSARKT